MAMIMAMVAIMMINDGNLGNDDGNADGNDSVKITSATRSRLP